MLLKADVLIVTVTGVEARTVLAGFKDSTGQKAVQHPIEDLIYHELGVVKDSKVFMVQSQMGSSGLGSSQQTIQKSIDALSPSAVIMVGIAFGINEDKQLIGDVLVSNQLMLYESQRVGTKGKKIEQITRGDRVSAPPRLVNRFQSAKLYWDETESGAKIRFGLILTGEKLVDNYGFREQLKEFEEEAIMKTITPISG